MTITMCDASIAPSPEIQSPGLIARLIRQMVMHRLSGLRRGQIMLEDSAGITPLGEPSDLQVHVHVHSPNFFRQTAMGGGLGAAESYLQGDWDCDDLTTLFRIFVRNIDRVGQLDRGLAQLVNLGHRIYHWWRSNSRSGSRRNVGAHYDLGNDFFRLWLDETMAYSSGIFPSPQSSLQEASEEKIDRVCRKLSLNANDHLLEIGTGWGGLAVHAAQNYGCRVTTTTISKEQFDGARDRIAASGLSDRITVLQRDYRDLSGQFDKLVSIEMIEAVGHRYFDTFFRKCSELLRPEGTMVLQAIVMPERRYKEYLTSVDFIQKYVFPGGCLPSTAAMLESAGRASDLRFVHAEDFAPHYAETLRRWRDGFLNQVDRVKEQGYSDQFLRLWNYYLCYCEAVFEERHVGVIQIQFDKPLCRRDPIELSVRAAASREPGRVSLLGSLQSAQIS